jgi:hypothetical protein
MEYTGGDVNQLVDMINQLEDNVVRARQELGLAKETEKEFKEKVVTKTEIEDLGDIVKAFKTGLRTGEITTKEEVKKYQKDFISIIEKSEVEDKGKFLKAVTRATTANTLLKEITEFQRRSDKLVASQQKRAFKEKIKKQLKTLTALKKDGKVKHEYQSYKHFKELKRINGLTVKQALQEVWATKDPETEADAMLMRMLSLKASGDKASPELYAQVYADLKTIERYGKQAKDQAEFDKRMERRERVDELREIDKTVKANKKTFLTKLGNFYRRGIADIEGILSSLYNDKIARKYETSLQEGAVNRAVQERKQEIDREIERIYGVNNSVKQITDMMADDGYVLQGEAVTFEMNRLDLINIYNAIKNEHTRTVYENQFGEAELNAMMDKLDYTDKQLGDFLMETVQEYRDVLNEASIRKFGRDMGTVENYWPRQSETEANLFQEYVGQSNIPGAVNARSGSNYLIPKKANAYLTAIKHIAQGEYADKMSLKYETIKRLFANPTIKNDIENKYGEGVYKGLMQHIEDQSLGGRTYDIDFGVNAINTIFNNWVVSKIAWNPTSIARQIGSFTNYAQHMNMADWAIGTSKALKNPKQTFDYMWKNSDYLQKRFRLGYNEALERAIKDAGKIGAKIQTITDLMTKPTRVTDIGAQIYGGYALVKDLEKTMSTEEAFKEFERISSKEQQSGLLSRRANIQKNPYMRWFFPFKNTVGQYTRLQVDAVYKYLHGDISKKQLAKVLFLIGVVQPTLYALTGSAIIGGMKLLGDSDEEIEEMSKDAGLDVASNIATQPFAFVPGANSISKYGARYVTGRDTWKIFSIPIIEEIEQAAMKRKKKEITPFDIMVITSMLSEMAVPNPSQTALRYYDYLKGE